MPDVFDRIADNARSVHAMQDQAAAPDLPAFSVTKRSDDGGLVVTVDDGRLASIETDSLYREEVPWPAMGEHIVALVNDALAEHSARQMEQYRAVHAGFADLVDNLSVLQADFRDAYERAVARRGHAE